MMQPVTQIEYVLLKIMEEVTPTEYRGGFYLPFRYIQSHVGMDIEIIRGFMRSMRNRQLVEYGHGFNEDGETTGSGYSLTERGRNRIKELAPLAALSKCELRQEDTSS